MSILARALSALSPAQPDLSLAVIGRTAWIAGQYLPPISIPLLAASTRTEAGLERDKFFGREALRMKGRSPEPLAYRPLLREGVIRDSHALELLLKQEFTDILQQQGGYWLRQRVLLTSRPGTASTRALPWLVERAGATKTISVPYAVACTLGIGLPLDSEEVQAVLAIEDEWFALAIFSRFGMLVRVDGAWGVANLTRTARGWYRHMKNIIFDSDGLAAHLCEHGWLRAGTVPGCRGEASYKGIGSLSDLPTEPRDMAQAVRPALQGFVEEIHTALETMEPDPLDQIRAGGIHLCGAGASVLGLAPWLGERLELTVHAHPASVPASVSGLLTILPDLDTVMPVLEQAGDWA